MSITSYLNLADDKILTSMEHKDAIKINNAQISITYLEGDSHSYISVPIKAESANNSVIWLVIPTNLKNTLQYFNNQLNIKKLVSQTDGFYLHTERTDRLDRISNGNNIITLTTTSQLYDYPTISEDILGFISKMKFNQIPTEHSSLIISLLEQAILVEDSPLSLSKSGSSIKL